MQGSAVFASMCLQRTIGLTGENVTKMRLLMEHPI